MYIYIQIYIYIYVGAPTLPRAILCADLFLWKPHSFFGPPFFMCVQTFFLQAFRHVLCPFFLFSSRRFDSVIFVEVLRLPSVCFCSGVHTHFVGWGIHACMHAWISNNMYTHIHKHTNPHTICTHIHTNTYTHTYTRTHSHTKTHTNAHTHSNTHKHTLTYTHTRADTHTHTHTHVHSHARSHT